MSVNRKVDKVMRVIGEAYARKVHGVGTDLHRAVVVNAPFDTGRLISSVDLSYGTPTDQDPGYLKERFSWPQAANRAMLNVSPLSIERHYTDMFVSSSVPYAETREYSADGYRGANDGFMRRAVSDVLG